MTLQSSKFKCKFVCVDPRIGSLHAQKDTKEWRCARVRLNRILASLLLYSCVRMFLSGMYYIDCELCCCMLNADATRFAQRNWILCASLAVSSPHFLLLYAHESQFGGGWGAVRLSVSHFMNECWRVPAIFYYSAEYNANDELQVKWIRLATLALSGIFSLCHILFALCWELNVCKSHNIRIKNT